MKKFIILFCFLGLFSVKAQNLPFIITEMMVNPEGNDTDREWIEVFNQSNQTFVIRTGRSGWRLNDGENHLFNEPSITIYPNEIFVIVQDQNKFLADYPDFKAKLISANFYLKNTSGRIQIFDENKNLIAEREYQGSCAKEGYSIIFENNSCQESKIKGGTPGVYPEEIKRFEVNEIKLENSNIQEKQTTSQPEIISEPENNLFQNEPKEKIKTIPPLTLYISEFLPNPEGNDKGQEFIEIYNYGDQEINLENFVLEVGQKKIKLQGIIEPKEYFVINNQDYDFYIRNQGEVLSLYFKEEKIFSISYEGKAPEGKSFSKFEDNWYFTQPTPGKENKLVLEKRESIKKIETEIKNETTTPLTANLPTSLQKEDKNNLKILAIFLSIIFLLSILSFIYL